MRALLARMLSNAAVHLTGLHAVSSQPQPVEPQPHADASWLRSCGVFDALYYLSTYPDVAASGQDPFEHYAQSGWKQGRNPHPLFDSFFYLKQSPEAGAAGENPLRHYLTVGWKQGRDPHPDFDTSFYLEQYPDVASLGICPLSHYIFTGCAEGRLPVPHVPPVPPPIPVPWPASAEALLQSLDIYHLPSPEEMSARYVKPLAALWAQHLAQRSAASIDERTFGKLPDQPRHSLIIPLYGRWDFLLHQIHHFSRDPDFQNSELIYVVDDPRIIDETKQLAMELSTQYGLGFRLVYAGGNYGYAAANNLGVSYARAPRLVLLNSDVFPAEKGWLSRMEAAHASLPRVGVLGARLLFEDGSIQHAGLAFCRDVRIPGTWMVEHLCRGLPASLVPSKGTVPVAAVTGACIMLSTELYRELGGIDEEYMLGDFEDMDLCLKLVNRGYVNYLADDIRLYHLERQSQNIGFDINWKSKLTICNAYRYAERWDSLICKLGAKD